MKKSFKKFAKTTKSVSFCLLQKAISALLHFFQRKNLHISKIFCIFAENLQGHG